MSRSGGGGLDKRASGCEESLREMARPAMGIRGVATCCQDEARMWGEVLGFHDPEDNEKMKAKKTRRTGTRTRRMREMVMKMEMKKM